MTHLFGRYPVGRHSLLFLPLMLLFSCTSQIEEIAPAETGKTAAAAEYGVADIFLSEEMAGIVESAGWDGGVPKTKSAGFNSALGTLDTESMTRIFSDGGEFERRHREAGLHRWYRITYSRTIPLTKAADVLEPLDGVLEVSPVLRAKTETMPFNDPNLPRQWHYLNDGSLSRNHSAGADINVTPVWERYTCGNRAVIVAVLDGGIDRAHEDLAANYVGGKNFVSGGQITADDHGTHVAGTIAARNNNGIGVCGVAGGNAEDGQDGVGLLSCQIFIGQKADNQPDALVWAADNGAVIANNSWGFDFETREEAMATTIPGPLRTAIDYFIKYAGCDNDGNQRADSPMKGGLVVFAAGNDAWDVDPICQYEPVFSVGAIGPGFQRAYYSNYGSWVDIAAPGGEQSTQNNTLILSTLPGNKYGWLQGTSMACPHVSGVAALIVSHFGGPGFTADMLKKRLLDGAREDVLPATAQIGPLVDALGAFTTGKTSPPAAPGDAAFSSVGNRINASFTVTADEDGDAAFGYMLLASENRESLEGLSDPRNLPDDVFHSETLVGNLKAGEEMTASLGSLDFETEYHVGIIGFDYAQNYSGISEISQIRTSSNSSPVIRCLSGTEMLTLKAHETAAVSFEIYDPEGEEVTVSFSKTSSASSLERTGDTSWKLNINARMAKAGEYEDLISASDPFGKETEYSFRYEILPNHAPEVKKVIENIYSESKTGEYVLEMDDFFYDADGESLRYSVAGGSKTVATAELGGSSLKISVSGYGLCKFSVTASDAKNASCSLEFNLMSKNPDNPVEMYPVPVTDCLTIRTGLPVETYVSVTTLSGTVVHESLSTVSAFEPEVIDMKSCAPGRYRVKVIVGGKEYDRIVTKI